MTVRPGNQWGMVGLVAGVVMALVSAGCGATAREDDDRVQVVLVWSGDELQQVRKVVAAFERTHDVKVDLVNPGDDIASFLRARHRADDMPDVAFLPQPGLIADYAGRGWLQPLSGEEDTWAADRYPGFWEGLGTADDPEGDPHFFGAWIKAAYKSTLWCLPDVDNWRSESRACVGVDEPTQTNRWPWDWESFLSKVRELAEDGTRAPLAVGAADGWVLTDWFENLLASHEPEQDGECVEDDTSLYEALATGEPCWDQAPVEAALADLADVFSIDGAFPEPGAERSLLTQFDESVLQVAATDQAAMLLAGDFVTNIALEFRPRDRDEWVLDPFPFPSPTDTTPVILGGDAAVVFEGSQHGTDLVEWLTDPDEHPERFRTWLTAGGYISPIAGTYDADFWTEDCAGEPDCALSRWIGQAAANATEDDSRRSDEVNVRFDLSNQLMGPCEGQLHGVLQDLFIDAGEDPDEALHEAIESMHAVTKGGRCRT